jgi:hypothetical protein
MPKKQKPFDKIEMDKSFLMPMREDTNDLEAIPMNRL